MDGQTIHATVLILYTHPLLGLGLQKLLASEPDLDVTALEAHEPSTAEAALANRPDIVIVERGEGVDCADVLHSVPDALVIDVGMDSGPSYAVHRDPICPKADGILDAIRKLRLRTGAALGILGAIAIASIS
ncbi:MAG TPA: hypothetical protein VF802_04730 [Candidatus Limnocylindrales bacterium]